LFFRPSDFAKKNKQALRWRKRYEGGHM